MASGGHEVCIGTRVMWGYICDFCMNKLCYRKCDACGLLFNKHQTALLVGETETRRFGGIHTLKTSDQPRFICDYCADTDGYITMKMQNRKLKDEASFQRRYEAIMGALTSGELLKDIDAETQVRSPNRKRKESGTD